jgi:uncharacterized membrane protein
MSAHVGAAAWLLLVALQAAWSLLAPDRGPAAAALALVPLLLPLTALPGGLRRALLWTGIVALGYFCHGVVTAWTVPPRRLPAAAEIALCVTLVGSLGAGAWRRKPMIS